MADLAHALGSAALMLALHGCGIASFTCEQDMQCKDGDVAGICEPGGGCSFPDPQCESGRRYGAHAPGGKGSKCVPSFAGSDSGDVETTGGASSTSVTTAESTSAADEAPNTDASTSNADDGSSTSTGGDASSDEGPSTTTGGEPIVFLDPFDRRDADELGNGWVENTPGAFQLEGQRVVLGTSNGGDFRANACHRPPEESLLDVEVTAQIEFLSEQYAGFPQLHLRVQPESFAPGNPFDGYVVFIDTTDPEATPILSVVRIIDAGFGDISNADLVAFPGSDQHYRLRARVIGVDPVQVDGYFEQQVGDEWNVLTETTLIDSNELRIVTAGMVGFSGHVALENFAVDDFGYRELSP